MIVVKFLILSLIFVSSTLVGWLIAKRYVNREKELKDMKNALNIFETKIKFTYASIPEIFAEIGKQFKENVIGEIFEKSANLMKEKSAGESWNESVEKVSSNMLQEDKIVIKNLSKLLGKTDVDGQINEIRLVTDFLDRQIQLAELERSKNEKMYRTLGSIIGLTLVIILI